MSHSLPTPPSERPRAFGPLGSSAVTASLDGLPALILGGAQFNHQYNEDPFHLPVKDIILQCFDSGICAIDTSAYYGPSEILIGNVLAEPDVRTKYPRDSYFLLTKAGRVSESEFDFSPEGIARSVGRSLDRLHTDYLDVVYAHDVEFVHLPDTLAGIGQLFALKDRGVIRNVGISGYPLPVLVALARLVRDRLGRTIDIVLSYSNFTLQNRRLKPAVRDLHVAGVRYVLNGSPLSMSLLRSQPPHAFHPASDELKRRVSAAAAITAEHNIELADIAMRYALRHWSGTTVVGWSSLFEVDRGIQAYWDSQNPDLAAQDDAVIEKIYAVLGHSVDEVWASGLQSNFDFVN
ncbi:Aldo/keto reductase family-domain-containing protein [Lipomyces japonicus]|uniref:Aldo/keto reductase family-domain-containing protein n=1 Tax=Lipomyces japonicus TaxID=56871 RepID=UPI0034CDC7AC